MSHKEGYNLCGKNRYNTIETAWKAAEDMLITMRWEQYAYHCPHCNKYHLTSQRHQYPEQNLKHIKGALNEKRIDDLFIRHKLSTVENINNNQ